METHAIRRTQVIKRPLKEVFTFFECPENLSLITPPSLGFNILTPQPVEMREGALIDYTIKMHGIPTHWITMITDYDPPYSFVDVQIKGPYRFWHHTHTFEEAEEGTRITDEVKYILPFGFLGRLINGLTVENQLRDIFDYRKKVIEGYFADAQMQQPEDETVTS